MKQLYLSVFALLISVLSGLYLRTIIPSTPYAKVLAYEGEVRQEVKNEYKVIPVLKKGSLAPVLSAKAALAYDVTSQRALFQSNPDERLLPASTTKIATALVALDLYNLDDIVHVQNPSINGQKMHLFAGENITVRNLLYGLLVYSANDAAQVLADYHPEGREAFVQAMNNKVKSLGLHNTSFINPSGLDSSNQFSTARDLTLLSIEAMKHPEFAQIVGTTTIDVKNVEGTMIHSLKNINILVGTIEGVLGVKTGWTENAKENLVTYVRRDGHDVVIVVLGSQDRFGETTTLIDWVFGNYSWEGVTVPVVNR